MPSIDLKARFVLTGPHNVKPVVDSLRRQFGAINVPINVKISSQATTGIANLNKHLGVLNKSLRQTRIYAEDLNYSMTKLGASFNTFSSGTKSIGQLQRTEQAIKKVQTSTKTASTELEKFGQSAAFAIRRFSAFTVAVGAVFGFVRALQTAVGEAIDFEKQLTKIAQVQGGVGNIKALSSEITKLSVTLGVSSKELVDVAQTLAQAGFSANDTKKALGALAKTTLAPTFNDIKNTTEAAIAAMAQFKVEASDLEDVLGSINAVAAAFAAESEDLTTVIRKAGSVFATAGSQLDNPKEQLNELLSLFTAVRSTTRESADTIATGFRTIFTRLQRGDTIQFLRNFNIELADSEGRFVGVFEAVRRLNAGLSHFQAGDLQLAEVIRQLAGRGEQVSKVIPLIQQFPKALEALNVATRGTNSLTKDQILAQETLANSIARVREEFFALIRGVTETDTFRVMTKSILGVASALIKVADSIKPVIPLLTALASIKLASAGLQFARGIGNELSGRNHPLRRASGGSVPGTGNSDSVLSLLTPGEFVIPKGAAAKLGPKVLGRLAKFAQGGQVGPTGRIAIGGQFDAFEFDVKGAASAISQFTKAITDAAVKIATQSAIGSPTATAINGGLHPERLDNFPLSPRHIRASERVNLPVIQSKGGFQFDSDLPGLAEDRIPFDTPDTGTRNQANSQLDRDLGRSRAILPKTRFGVFPQSRLGAGKFSPLGIDSSRIDEPQNLGIKTSFGVGNRGFGPGALGSASPLGDNVQLLNTAQAQLRKLPSSLSHYDDALALITAELEKGVSAEKARNNAGKKLLARSIRQLSTDDFTAGSKDLRNSAVLKAIGSGQSPIPGGARTSGPGLGSRLAGLLTGTGSTKPLTEQQQLLRSQRLSNVSNAAGFAGLLVAGQLENTSGRAGKAAGSGLSSGLISGGLAASVAGGPVGAVVGVTAGIVAGLDRFLSETNRLAVEAHKIKFDADVKNVNKLVKSGASQDKIDAETKKALENATQRAAAENNPLRDLGTIFKASGFSFFDGGVGQGQRQGQFLADTVSKISDSIRKDAEEVANPQFEAIRQRIAGGTALSNINITSDQKKLFGIAGKDMNELFNADKIRQSQQALSKLISNIEVLGTQFDKLTAVTEADISVMERFNKQQQDVADIVGGNTRISSASSGQGNILSNVKGFSGKTVGSALESIGVDARTKSIISSGKTALDKAPGIFSKINVAGDPGAAKAELSKQIQGLHLDKAIEDTILHDIRNLDITGDGESEFREKFKELAENLDQNINKILDPAIKSAQALAKKQEVAANQYIDGLNRVAEAQSRLRETLFDASDTKLEARRSIATAQGRELTDAEARSSLTAKTGALGIAGPAGLGNRISALRARGVALTEARNNVAPGSNEFKSFTDKLAANNDELDRAQKALELFAKDTTLAGIAADKLQKAEAKRAVGREVAGGILGNDKLGFAKKINALGRFQGGDLRSLVTNFEDVQSGVDLQSRFLRANGRGKEADAVEANFDKGIGKVLGPEFAAYFKSIRDEEVKAKADQVAAAKVQITAAEESIKASQAALQFYNSRVPGRARGGMIRGAGTSTSDSISARLSDGEYVVNAAAVRNVGVDTLDDINAMGFAYGGRVRRGARSLISKYGYNRAQGHRGFFRNGRLLSPYHASRFDLMVARKQDMQNRRAAFRGRRRRGFATGGLVEGGGVNMGDASLAGINAFAIAANNLANALQNVNIPSHIEMVGTHNLNINLNGAAVLNLLKPELQEFVLTEIQAGIAKYDRNLRQ